MKNCKVILLAFVALLLSTAVMAQKSARKVAKETATAVSKMDAKDQQMILNYTRDLAKVDVKKELMKNMKKMSAEDRQKVLDYVAKVNESAASKAAATVAKVKPEVPATAKAKANTNTKVNKPAKPKVETPVVDPATLTQIEILDPTFDFGTIPQGEKAATTYRVKNVGNNPLKISKAKGSCGCTVPQWPKEEIAPGEIAEIKVVFNSRGKKGKQNKRITITTNTDPPQNYMTITGMVEVPAPAAPAEGNK